jgi:hypothetical protein
MDNVNQGIGGASVRLEVWQQGPRGGALITTRTVQTNALGFFDAPFTLTDGAYTLSAWFDGGDDALYEGCSAQRRLEVSRWDASLTLSAPALAHLPPETSADLTFTARLTSTDPHAALAAASTATSATSAATPSGPPASLPVTLRGGSQGWSQPLTLEGLSLPASATVRYAPNTDAPLGWGRQTLTAHFHGDDLYAPAQAEATLTLVRSLTVSLKGGRVRDRERRGVLLHGLAQSPDAPLTDVALTIELRREGDIDPWRRVGEVRADTDGAFSAFIDDEALPPGVLAFQVRLTPDVGPEARSAPVVVEIARSGIGAWALWLLGGLIVGGGLIGVLAVLAARLTAWARRAWEARRRRRALTQPQVVTPLPLPEPPPDLPDQPNAIGGRVFDTLEGTSLPNVHLTLRHAPSGDQERTLLTDAAGGFLLLDLPPGRRWLEAQAHGYVTARVEVWSPHDGSLRYFRLNLTPVRQVLRERYAWLLNAYSPQRALWGQHTPQEIRGELLTLLHATDQAAQARDTTSSWGLDPITSRLRLTLDDPHAPLASLWALMTALIEEVYFSHRLYPASLLSDIDTLCARLEGPLTALRLADSARRGAVSDVGRSRSDRSAAREAS